MSFNITFQFHFSSRPFNFIILSYDNSIMNNICLRSTSLINKKKCFIEHFKCTRENKIMFPLYSMYNEIK